MSPVYKMSTYVCVIYRNKESDCRYVIWFGHGSVYFHEYLGAPVGA